MRDSSHSQTDARNKQAVRSARHTPASGCSRDVRVLVLLWWASDLPCSEVPFTRLQLIAAIILDFIASRTLNQTKPLSL